MAFGDWSATFREFLKDNFTPSELAEMGVEDVESFISKALIEIAENWAGRKSTPPGRVWKDARWLDEPLWLAYDSQETDRRKGLRNYYNA